MSPIDGEHLSRHALITCISAQTVIQEGLASLFDGHLVRTRSICASLHLAFYLNAEHIGQFFGHAMLTLSIASAIRVVDDPSSFGLAQLVLPCAFTDFS